MKGNAGDTIVKKIDLSPELVRVALYIRVSGEEQKIKGLSLEAQQERLEAYARERGWVIVGIYIDAAKTARKNIHKRTDFQRMMDSVKRDEVNILLFCRLDRWFRSVADYYKIMEVLEAHNCDWKTTDEEYDTTTANGRLYINVKLSIAQNEADIDGERIDVVFDSKIAHGTVVSGSAPFGFRVNEEKRLEVVPEDAAIVQDAFNYFETSISQRATVRYIRETYGVNWCDATFRRMLKEKLYTGVYDRGGRFNDHFCPAIISKQQFDRVQALLERNARSVPSGKVYIFTSILTCAECGHKLVLLTNHAILTTIITMKAATTIIPVRKKIFHWFFRSSICFCAFCLYSSAVSSSSPFFQRIPFHLASVPFFIVTVRHFPANGNILSAAGSLNYCLSYPDRSGHLYR